MKEVDTMTNTSITRKPTKRDHFNALLAIPAVAENADLVAFIEHEVELLDKKNTAERKPTAKQVENAGFKSDILAWTEPATQYAAADVVKGVPSIVAAGLSANRVTAMLTQLVNDGSLVRTEDKRKNFYSLA
jgi:negative regulator of sigma E activity